MTNKSHSLLLGVAFFVTNFVTNKSKQTKKDKTRLTGKMLESIDFTGEIYKIDFIKILLGLSFISGVKIILWGKNWGKMWGTEYEIFAVYYCKISYTM